MVTSAAHAVDDQLAARLARLGVLTTSAQNADSDRALRRELALTVACVDDVRTSHPLDADGWCVPCTTPPGAPDLSTVYGCQTRVTLARHLLGLYVMPLHLVRPPAVRGKRV